MEENNLTKKKKEKKPFKQRKSYAKVLTISGIALGSIVFILLATAGSYIGYVAAQYYRIEDNKSLTIEAPNGENSKVKSGLEITEDTNLSILTYNIGFGAYDQEYDFFLDEGIMKDGTKIVGRYAKARDAASAKRNTAGSINIVKNFNADFSLIQEIDKDSDRCYHINQYEEFKTNIAESSNSVYASNFHTAYLAYPFNDPIGKTEAGLATFSKYKIDSSIRKSYPVDESFPTKFFDLDRCFSVSRIKLSNGKDLLIGNSHMSAYDEGGLVRKKQIAYLKEFLEQEKDNYVIIGGDYNHDICDSVGKFPTEEQTPGWAVPFPVNELPEGYSLKGSLNAATCRAAEMPYVKGKNYLTVIDGFIVNDKIINCEVTNLDEDFMYSDHNPATMKFNLDF